MTDDLNEHEIELLRDMAGMETSITGWGSWMATAAGALARHGLCTPLPNAQITDKGRQWLKEMDDD